MEFIEDRKEIAKKYLKFWFWIDLMVTLPYDVIVSRVDSDVSNIAYLAKFIRIMKIVRLIRLLKLVKVAKDRERIQSILLSRSNLSSAVERLVLSIFGFFILCHVIACGWIIQARLRQDGRNEDDWIS